MANRLNNRVAVITGSGQGVGRAIAIAMAEEGAKVVTNNRQPGSTGPCIYGESFFSKISQEQKEWMINRDAELTGDAETTARKIIEMGGQAVPFFGDVSDFEVARKLIQTAVDRFGKIDILVNTAGAFRRAWIWEMAKEADWDLIVNSHLNGTFNCIRHAVGLMRKQRWGRIINTTSSAWLGSKSYCNYSAAKAGIIGLTRGVAGDMYQYGVTCNVFSPGAMTRSLFNLMVRARVMADAGTPIISTENLERIAAVPGPEAIAPFIVYLATDDAAYISGTVFAVRGSRVGVYPEPIVEKTINKEELWTVDELVKSVPTALLEGYKSPVSD